MAFPVLAWFRLLHPFPSLLNAVAVALFAELASEGRVPASVLLRLVALVACSQFAIGSANDVVDRRLDAASKPWKPIAAGQIAADTAATLAVCLSAGCLILAASLGLGTVLASALGLGCGLAYDLRLKRSAWSWLPYCIGIPTLPVCAWVAVAGFTPRLLLLYPLGTLLGLGLHLANTLPDLEADRAFGVRGLAHILGRRRSATLCWCSIGGAQLGTLLMAPFIGYHGWGYPAGLATSCSLLIASAVLYRLRPTQRTLQINFGLLALASLALALGWLTGALR